MLNYGFELSNIDGSEFIYENENVIIPTEFSYMKNLPKVLNQGEDPICVPCSISAWCEYKLSTKSGIKKDSKFKLFDIFNSRTNVGEGMSCKEAFSYMKNIGATYGKNNKIKIDRYYRVTSILHLRNAIINNGPCIIALPVYDQYKDEFWIEDGPIQGYHAVSVVGYDKNGFIIRNSWGESFGYSGYAYLQNEDFGSIIEAWTLI